MVACYVIGGGDGGKAAGHRFGITGSGTSIAVLQITQLDDEIGGLCVYGSEKGIVGFTELGAVQVTEDHDTAAIKPLWKVGEDRVKIRGLQRDIAPADKEKHCCKEDQQL